MVQIGVPATPQFALGDAPVDSGALTEDSIEGGLSEGDDLSGAPSGFQTPSSLTDDSAHEQAIVPGGETGLPDDDVDPLDPARPAWESERTQKSRQVAMLVALSTSALVVSGLIFFLFVRGWGANSGAQQVASIDESNSPTQPPDGREPNAGADPTSDDGGEPESTPADPSTSNVSEDSDPPATGPDDVEVVNETPTSIVDSDQAELPPNMVPKSPLDDPLSSPLSPTTGPSAKSNPDDGEQDDNDPVMLKLPEGLEEITSILDLSQQQATPTRPAPPSLDQLQVDRPTIEKNDPTLIASPPEPINARRALGIETALQAVDQKYPLNDLTLMMSQITGAPIHVEWVSFDLVGISIDQSIPVPSGWLTAGEHLERIAEAVSADVKIEEFLIRVEPKSDRLIEATDAMIDLSDLGGGEASGAALVNQLLHAKANESAPGDVIDPADVGQRQITALACEALRRVRGVKGKISDSSLFRWSFPLDPDKLDWPILKGHRSANELFSPDIAASLFRRLAHGNGATCYVNWIDATRRRMAPSQKVMPYMGDTVDAGTAIAECLEPFQLQVRQVDDTHWWIGSEASYDQFPVIAWTEPVSDPKAFEMKVRRILSSNPDLVGNVVIDGETDRALMLLPRYLLRQVPDLLKKVGG